MSPATRSTAPLREKGGLTRLMVLRALHRRGTATLREIAEEVGVTVQAVSEHVKRLHEDGHVATGDDGPRVTQEGLEHLKESLAALKEYVDSATRELARIEATAARAAAPVQAGETVGLFMEDGELVAYPGKDSPSRGRAVQDAAAGEDLVVEALEGIVHLEPGRVVLGVVPDAASGGSRKVDLAKAETLGREAGVVIALGPVARRVAERIGTPAVRYGGAAVAADAAVRGVDALVLTEARELPDVEERLRRALAERGLKVEPTVVRLDPVARR